MHYRVDNQLSNGIRRNLIHVPSAHAFESGAHMDVAQHILVGLFDEFLGRTRELSPIHKHSFGGSFEYAALHHGPDSRIASQNRIGVGGHQLPVLFCQHTPLQQLFLRNCFDFRGVFGIILRGFRQTCAQCFNVFFRYGQSKALYLVEAPAAAFDGQLPNGGLVCLTRGASYTNECSLFLAERLDMVRTLQAGSDLGYDNRLAVHIMHGDVGNNQWLAAIDDGVRNGVHYREHLVFGNANHTKCLIFDTEHQASALSIGKRHRGFGVVDAPGRRRELVLHILGFAAQQGFQVIRHRRLSSFSPEYGMLRTSVRDMPLRLSRFQRMDGPGPGGDFFALSLDGGDGAQSLAHAQVVH